MKLATICILVVEVISVRFHCMIIIITILTKLIKHKSAIQWTTKMNTNDVDYALCAIWLPRIEINDANQNSIR